MRAIATAYQKLELSSGHLTFKAIGNRSKTARDTERFL